MLGSGNLGLVYLMDEPRRLTLEEIEQRHPRLIAALRAHPAHRLAARALRARTARSSSAPRGRTGCATGDVEGDDPLAPFAPNAPRHLLRTDGFDDVADIMVGSFYDPQLEEGCAFEELISLPRRARRAADRPFVLPPSHFPLPDEPIVGAEELHRVLKGWRAMLQGG